MASITSEGDQHGQVPNPDEEMSPSILATSTLDSILATWPTKLCLKCVSMTGTMEGLRDLISRDGYRHHGRRDLEESVRWGCGICVLIFKVASGSTWMDPVGDSNEFATGYFDKLENGDSIAISARTEHSEDGGDSKDGEGSTDGENNEDSKDSEEGPSVDLDFLDRPLVVFQHLFIGWLSRSGDSHYVYSLDHWHSNRLRMFTDAQDDKYSNSVVLDSKLLRSSIPK